MTQDLADSGWAAAFAAAEFSVRVRVWTPMLTLRHATVAAAWCPTDDICWPWGGPGGVARKVSSAVQWKVQGGSPEGTLAWVRQKGCFGASWASTTPVSSLTRSTSDLTNRRDLQ